MKYITSIVLAFMLTVSVTTVVFAGNDHEGATMQGKSLVESQVSCDELTDEQLESIGEYIMEQMHPGDAHGTMDEMMGGEGSDSLRKAHTFIAQRWYCGNGGGMGMMMGNWNMMGAGGMMNWGNSNISNQNGNMNSYGYGANMMGIPTAWHQMGSITSVLVWIFLLTGIAACVKYLVKKQS